MATETLLVFFILFTLNNVIYGEVCYTETRYTYGYSYEYCESGCCGYYYSNACCMEDVGLIIGLVIGGVLLVAVVIIIIIACHMKNKYINAVRAAQPNYGNEMSRCEGCYVWVASLQLFDSCVNSTAPTNNIPSPTSQAAALPGSDRDAGAPSSESNVSKPSSNQSGGTLSEASKQRDLKDKGKGKNPTKEDTSTSTDFRHVSHWDPNKGFDIDSLDPSMKELFKSMGIDENDAIDEDEENVDIIVKAEMTSPPPPAAPECIICMDKNRDCVFVDCGHLVTCYTCGVMVDKCPLCRADIKRKIKVFQ